MKTYIVLVTWQPGIDGSKALKVPASSEAAAERKAIRYIGKPGARAKVVGDA